MSTPKPVDVDGLRALLAAAEPAPWNVVGYEHEDNPQTGEDAFISSHGRSIAMMMMADVDLRNADLIAMMRNRLPALLDELTRLRAEVKELDDDASRCGTCDRVYTFGVKLCERCWKAEHAAAEARAVAAEANYAACAHAIGVEYVADNGPTEPGPVDTVVDYIRDAVRGDGERIELDMKLTASRAEVARLRGALEAESRLRRCAIPGTLDSDGFDRFIESHLKVCSSCRARKALSGSEPAGGEVRSSCVEHGGTSMTGVACPRCAGTDAKGGQDG